MKQLTTSIANLLGVGLATSEALADVRPPPGSVNDFGGLGTFVGATLLTAVFILGGLWLARKVRDRK
jgi:hypothetical protein